jgi:hypothetical protein
LNSEKIGKIQKIRAYIHHHQHHYHQEKQLGKISLKYYYIGKGEITQANNLGK